MNALLITGGTGTIGQACALVALEGSRGKECGKWDRIVIYSRDEYKQALMEKEFSKYPNASKLRFFLGDVRDLLRLEMAMSGITHVIHAAALKRIEKCENDPIEAIKTNVDGTANVIHAAIRKSVSHVCAVSTDKAVRPISLYGSTKLTMERLVLAANNIGGGKCTFSVVRLGNIFGSRGSVVEIWKNILDAGSKTIPISDPKATRFFERAHSAATLVVDRTLFGEAGIQYPSILPAYSLSELAEAMGAEDFDIIGLGKYEKLHEELSENIHSGIAPRMGVERLKEELNALF